MTDPDEYDIKRDDEANRMADRVHEEMRDDGDTCEDNDPIQHQTPEYDEHGVRIPPPHPAFRYTEITDYINANLAKVVAELRRYAKRKGIKIFDRKP